MKSNKLIYALSFTVIFIGLCISGCKKKENINDSALVAPQVIENGQTAIDNWNTISENDAAYIDINTEVSANNFLHGKNSLVGVNSIYNALGITATSYSVDTTGAYLGTIKLNYNNTTSNNRTKTGSIKLTILNYPAKKWKDAGCVLKVEYISYKVTRASDGKSVELNGIQNLTNETGGTWLELVILKTQPSMVASVTGNSLNVIFEGNKTAVYNINCRYTYTLPGGILTCKCEGIGVSNGYNNLENYGTNRDGIAFTVQVIKPLIWNWTCGSWAPAEGMISIKASDRIFSVAIFFSVDSAGNVVIPSSNQCPYGWKLEWVNSGVSDKRIFGYL